MTLMVLNTESLRTPISRGGDPVTPTGAWSLGINPNSAHEDAARKFIRFVTATAEGSEAWADGVGNIPANEATRGVYFEKETYSGDEMASPRPN